MRAIRAETEGNPFFVKQLVRHLEEAGRRPAGGRDGLGVPAGVRDVIARRVARLPARAGEVLRVAALIGRDFEYELLQRVADVPADELLDILDAAVRGALLAEVPSTPGRYSFAHALLRSTMEAELSATRRALLHRRIGEAIEERHRDRLEPGWTSSPGTSPRPGRRRSTVPSTTPSAPPRRPRTASPTTRRCDCCDRAVALRGRDDPVDHAELGRLESALATAESGAGTVGGGARELRAAPRRRRGGGGGRCLRVRGARPLRRHVGAVRPRRCGERALLQEALDRLPEGDSRLRCAGARAAGGARSTSSTPPRGSRCSTPRTRRWRSPGGSTTPTPWWRRSPPRRTPAGNRAERRAARDRRRADRAGRGTRRARRGGGGHLWRAVALLELCELDEAEPHLARYGELAERVQQFQLLVVRDRAAHDAHAATGRLRGRRGGGRGSARMGQARAAARQRADAGAASDPRGRDARPPQRA